MTGRPVALRLQHNKISLAVHRVDGDVDGDAEGPNLLLLHGLGESSPSTVPPLAAAWPGPVWGLDFTGHGASTVPVGGGYTAEILLGDVDHVLGRLGPVTIFGRGLGAYVGLLAQGARPQLVRGVVLADGPGLAGGGSEPPSALVLPVAALSAGAATPPDPLALSELSRDIRPPDYATGFVRQALQLSGIDQPIAVCAYQRPEWLRAVAREFGVFESSADAALATFAAAVLEMPSPQRPGDAVTG